MEVLASIWAIITTEGSIRLLSSVDIFLFTFVSVGYAFRILSRLRDFDRDDFIKRIPGPKPHKTESLERQARWKRDHASSILRLKLMDSFYAMALGVGVPLAAFCFITLYPEWFVIDGVLWRDARTNSILTEPTGVQMALFFADQALKGGLNDVFEVFQLSVSTMTNDPTNFGYAGVVLAFRMIMDVFVLSLVIFALSAITAWRDVMGELR